VYTTPQLRGVVCLQNMIFGGITMKKLLAIGVLAALGLMGQDGAPDGDSDDGGSPVPEPATIGLMGVGIAAIGFAAWRKNRKK